MALIIYVVLLLSTSFSCLAANKNKTEKSQRDKSGQFKYSGKCKPKVLAEYELAFHGGWSEAAYPRMFPKYRPSAEWSKLVGRSHSSQYSMWTEGKVASAAVQFFAERSDTRGFDTEVQAYGGIRDTFTAAPIQGGLGKTSTNFITDGLHSQVSFMVRLMPSPDWFVGLSSFDLCEETKWKSHLKIDLHPMDAGTDRGLTFTSPDWPSEPLEPVYRLSPSAPPHSASSFYYENVTSLPPIAKVYLTKIAEYRRKGDIPKKVKQERNLVIFYPDDDIKKSYLVPTIEDNIDKVLKQEKETRENEIATAIPKTEKVTDSSHSCVLSEWSEWTRCSTTCGFGRQEHRRTIIKRSQVPGLYCPVLREDRTCDNSKTCSREAFQFLNRKS